MSPIILFSVLALGLVIFILNAKSKNPAKHSFVRFIYYFCILVPTFILIFSHQEIFKSTEGWVAALLISLIIPRVLERLFGVGESSEQKKEIEWV